MALDGPSTRQKIAKDIREASKRAKKAAKQREIAALASSSFLMQKFDPYRPVKSARRKLVALDYSQVGIRRPSERRAKSDADKPG